MTFSAAREPAGVLASFLLSLLTAAHYSLSLVPFEVTLPVLLYL